MAHTELDLRERRAIEDMLNSKVPVSKIAVEIGRHRSTVFREIKRNRFVDEELPKLNGYYGMNAQRSAVDRRARRRKLVRFVELRQHVIAQLKVGCSLMASLWASVMRRSMPMFTVQMASPKNLHATCHTAARNGSQDVDVRRAALFFRLID